MRTQRLLAAVLWVAPFLAWGIVSTPRTWGAERTSAAQMPGTQANGAHTAGAHELRFAGGTVRIAPGQPSKSAVASATLSAPAPDWFAAESPAPVAKSPHGRRYLLAVAPGGLAETDRATLTAAGAEILDYIPVHGYRLRLPPAAEHAVQAMPFVAWLGEAPAHLKVAPELLRRASLQTPAAGSVPGVAGGSASPAGNELVPLRVILAADEPAGRTLEILRDLDVMPAPSGKDGAWRIAAQVPAARLRGLLARLAALPEVEAVEPKRAIRALNQDAVWVHQSFVGPSPVSTPIFDRGIFGCGQTVGIADTGQDYDSCYFQRPGGAPRVASCAFAPCPFVPSAPGNQFHKDFFYYNWSGTPTGDEDFCPGLGTSGHGTHTSGSIAGDTGTDGVPATFADCAGFSSPGRTGGDGQAPGARLVVQEMGDGFEYLNDRGGSVWNLADVAFRTQARIHSNSWGGTCGDIFVGCSPGCTIPYESLARDADLAMWTYPDLLIVASAGNDGETCPAPVAVGIPANAKSVLSVGSVGHGSAATTPSSFSSPGPVFDGRLKPEIAAQGEDTVSAASDSSTASPNCGSCALSGTSMSAPTVAGLAALVREYYLAGFYTSGTRTLQGGIVPSGALMKATLIDGAVALGATAPQPDFESGYGRALLADTLAFPGSAFSLRVDDHRSGLLNGSVLTHAYNVAAGTPFRATLVWSDAPAALNAATARVNELRLEVIDPSGAVWFQTIDAASGLPVATSDPAAPHDTLNVSERLVFPNPVAGRWGVRVVGVDVPMGPQPFALVVRGALTDCPAPAVPSAASLATPAEHQVTVSWPAVPGAATYNVYRSLGACPGGPPVLVAGGVAGTSFTDSGMSGGTPYSYTVAAAADAAGLCASAPSPCASVVPTGDCTLPPRFDGVRSVVRGTSAQCHVVTLWDFATSYCAGDVRYNVYRSADPSFTPGPANRIARCVPEPQWFDSSNLASGVEYHYIVRAEDATSGHGGPCRGGNEDPNLVRLSAAPVGPPALGTWRDDGGDTGPAILSPAPPWTNEATGGNTAPRVWSAQSDAGVCSNLTSPTLSVGEPGLGPVLSFATRHTLEYDPIGIFGAEGSLGQVEVATGPSFGNWARLALNPEYPQPVEFPLNDCPTTQNFDTYFSGTAPYSTYTASLANWGGSEVRLRWHLSGDYLFPGGGWWIDDVQVTNVMTDGVCSTSVAGPPPIPDGAYVVGEPLRVTAPGPASSGPLTVTWDATRCPAAAVNLYWGTIGGGPTLTGAHCGLPPTGSATVTLPDNVWFVVAATDGVSTDGSHSRLGNVEVTYPGAGTVCPAITSHVTNNGCP